jgi:plastocyanin
MRHETESDLSGYVPLAGTATRGFEQMLRTMLIVLVATVAVAAPLAALAAQPGTRSQEPEVEMEDFAFRPARIAVRPSQVVIWKNRDRARHNATSVKRVNGRRVFRTATRGFRGEATARAPRRPGTYGYFCTVHPQMKGTLVVRR